jgi:signal transduction histidine kinase
MSKPDADHVSAGTLQTFSIRTKLLVFVASLVVILGTIAGVVAVSSGRTALTKVIGRQLAGESRNAADRLASTLRTQRDNLDSFARQDVMREIRIGDLDKRISSFLASLRSGCPICLDFLVFDREDRVVAASHPSALDRLDVPLPTATDRPTVEGPLASPAHGRPILRFWAPIPDPDRPAERLGWLLARIDWERASDATLRVRENLLAMGIDADVLVLDADGLVIGGAPRPHGAWRLGARIPFATHPAATVAPEGHVDRSAGVLFGAAAMPDGVFPWSVVVAEPLREAFAPVRRMAWVLAAVLAATLLAALAVALAAARRVTRPLATLTAAALAVGRGDGPPPAVVVRTRDEIGTLAAAFNRMAVDLAAAERRLVDAAKFAFVGELAAGVAHEVRTPLGVLRSSTQLLARSYAPPDAESRELLQIMRDEVDRVERVVSGLLELGRPRELRLEAAALGAIVFRAADFVEAQARGAGVALRRHPLDPDPLTWCDPDLVYQVVLNLLVNAIQVLAPGRRVDLVMLPTRDGMAGFEVRDDGPGVPPDLRERIFQPFVTRREGGSGLGLTFVQRVVLEHHGRVTVGDNAGGGAVFRVELPAAAEVQR